MRASGLGDLSWFKRLDTPHRLAIASAEELSIDETAMEGAGTVIQAGGGAGMYTFVKMRDSGHCESFLIHFHWILAHAYDIYLIVVELAQPGIMRNLMDRWVKNQTFT